MSTPHPDLQARQYDSLRKRGAAPVLVRTSEFEPRARQHFVNVARLPMAHQAHGGHARLAFRHRREAWQLDRHAHEAAYKGIDEVMTEQSLEWKSSLS